MDLKRIALIADETELLIPKKSRLRIKSSENRSGLSLHTGVAGVRRFNSVYTGEVSA